MARKSTKDISDSDSGIDEARRVALDQGYDRLGQRHAVRYACEECSKSKEAQRVRQVDASQKPL